MRANQFVASEEGFFDSYPRFYSTSTTGANANRLNQRHRALIESNAGIIQDKAVLDIASHDGRWSLAAYKAGARQVLGIEARQHLVNSARANMEVYQVAEDRVHFVLGDVFEELDRLQADTFETVLCFGFFYHTLHHMLLLSKITRLRPKHVIFDTQIDPAPTSVIRIFEESTAKEGAGAVADAGTPTRVLVGVPSRSALELMLASSGLTYSYYQWRQAGIERWDGLNAYRKGLRVSLVSALRDT
jgi:SAM-dependent methyltransferase